MIRARQWVFVATAAVAALIGASAGGSTDAPSAAAIDPRVTAALSSGPAVDAIVSIRGDAAAPGTSRRAQRNGARIDAALGAARGAERVRRFEQVGAFAARLTAADIAALRAHPDVIAVSPNIPVQAQLEEAAALIGAYGVHTALNITGAGTEAAVLDSGIDADHPALMTSLLSQQCYLDSGDCPTASNTFGGCTPNANVTGPYAEDGATHGSHVSGIITSDGSGGNDVGIARDAGVHAYKILNDCGNGTIANIVAAYNDIMANHTGVDVINLSLGDGSSNAAGTCELVIPAMTTAVASAKAMGMLTFASSGNTGVKGGISYPACINDIVAVGATYDATFGPLFYGPCNDPTPATDEVACFSQSGNALDLLAPGAVIESTVPFGSPIKSGTSMSSPAAAAVALLIRQDEPSFTAAQIEARLRMSGIPITDPANGLTACRVDAGRATGLTAGPVCLDMSPDTDGDGCSDGEEAQASPLFGGERDAGEWWDFFDINGDQIVDLTDAIDVLGFFGDDGTSVPANLRDRASPDMLKPWRTAETDDGIDLNDAIVSLQSFGHDCSY